MVPVLRHQAESLSVQQLQTFCNVYECGGYAKAEERLGLAGPTMWEQVKALEKIYKTALFERAGRNIRPTAAGNALYELLCPLLAGVESTFEIMAEQTETAEKQVSLVTGVRMMLEELGKPLRQFMLAHQGVQMRLITADNRTAQESVLEGKANAALLIEPPPEILFHGIACERLYPIEYLAILPARHRLARKSDFSLKDLVYEPLIVGNPNTVGRQQLEQAIFRLGLSQKPFVVAETDNSAVTIACVRAGIGIGIIAGRPAGNLTRHVQARSLASELGHVHVVAAYEAGRNLTRLVRDLLDQIKLINVKDASC